MAQYLHVCADSTEKGKVPSDKAKPSSRWAADEENFIIYLLSLVGFGARYSMDSFVFGEETTTKKDERQKNHDQL